MMKKSFKVALGCVFSTFLVAIGVLLGSYITDQKIKNDEGSLYTTTKIAVVNLDEGVDYEGKHRNFAKELISAQNEDLTITGLNDAKSGIENGRYAAYIIMPSDFSSKVVTINTEPKKSLILYEISKNLSDTAKDKTTLNVMDVNNSINDDLGYMYLYSVFNEFHNGQNNALKVISNDSKDKEVLMAISNVDLIESIDIREVERLESNVENLDIVDDFEKNQELIETIDLAYKRYLGKIEDETNGIKSDSVIIDNNLNDLRLGISNIPILKDGNTNNYSLDKADTKLESFNLSLTTSLELISNQLNTAQSENSNVAGNIKNASESFLNTIKEQNSKLADANQYENIKNQIKDSITSIDLTKFNNLKTIIDELNTNIDELNTQIEELRNINKGAKAESILEKYISNKALEYAQTNSNKNDILNNIFKDAELDDEVKKAVKEYAKANKLESSIDSLESYYKYTRNNATTPNTFNMTNDNDITPTQDDIVNALKKDLNSLASHVLLKLDDSKEKYPTSIDTSTFESALALFETSIPNLNIIKDDVSKINGVNKDEVKDEVHAELEPLANRQSSFKLDLISNIASDRERCLKFIDRLGIYNPLVYIDEREMKGFLSEYKSNTFSVESKITSKDTEYKSFVDKSYQHANEHVDSLKEDTYKYQKSSDEKIETGLEVARASRSESSSENQELMSNFIKTLPYSRLGDAENTAIHQFIVNPINGESTTLATKNVRTSTDYNSLIIIFLGVSGVLMIGIILVSQYFVLKKKKRKS